jgi:hypothetical protein
MIRVRLRALEAAVADAIEMARVVREEAAIVDPALHVMARAAGSERAAYWVLDLARVELRVIASWSSVALRPSTPHRGLRYSTALRCRVNAAHVWRSRKPFWSGSIVLDTNDAQRHATVFGSGVWFAVKSDTFVYGVIELLGRALEQRAPDNLFVLERLGFRLGQAFEEHRHLASSSPL